MKQLILSLVFLTYLFVGCSKNNPTEPAIQSDSELKSAILGTWASTYLTIDYNADGSFFETINYYIYSDSSTTPPEAIRGTYDIKNGILVYQINEWKIFENVNKRPLNSNLINNGNIFNEITNKRMVNNLENELFPIYSIPDFKIQFEGDQLYFYPLSILTSIGANTDGLWGEWTTTHWAVGSGNYTLDSIVLGKLEWRYKFDKSSKTVTYGSKFLIDTSGTFDYLTDAVEYNPPDLKWAYYEKTIEFHEGQMYMFEKLKSIIPLKRIK